MGVLLVTWPETKQPKTKQKGNDWGTKGVEGRTGTCTRLGPVSWREIKGLDVLLYPQSIIRRGFQVLLRDPRRSLSLSGKGWRRGPRDVTFKAPSQEPPFSRKSYHPISSCLGASGCDGSRVPRGRNTTPEEPRSGATHQLPRFLGREIFINSRQNWKQWSWHFTFAGPDLLVSSWLPPPKRGPVFRSLTVY